MREILFRGKREDNGEWVYGDLLHDYASQGDTIRQGAAYGKSGYFAIVPDTIGQFTGLLDKYNDMIFEGDVVKCTDGADETNELNSDTGTGEVEWLKKWGFWNISNIENGLGDILHNGYVEVIGNIHDNPELSEQNYEKEKQEE